MIELRESGSHKLQQNRINSVKLFTLIKEYNKIILQLIN